MNRIVIILCFLSFIVSTGLWSQKNYSFDKLSEREGLGSNTVYDIAEDHLGFLWMATKGGLYRFDGYDFKKFDLPSSGSADQSSVLSLLVDHTGTLWIGLRSGGLVAYQQEDQTFRKFPFDDNNTVDWSTITVKSIYEDTEMRLWVGTFGGGTIVLDQQRKVAAHFCTYCNAERREQLSNDFVFDFAEDEVGNVYIATAGKGLNIYRHKLKIIEEVHTIDASDMNSFGKTLCMDCSGKLWIGTEGSGLYVYDAIADDWQNFRAQDEGLRSNIITDIKEGENGRMWVATDGGGVVVVDNDAGDFQSLQYDPTKPNSLSTDAIYDLHFDRSGNLWIGTFNGGVNSLKAIQSPFWMSREYDIEKRKGLRSVLCIQEDYNKRVWVGTDGGGLFYFDVSDDPLDLHTANELLIDQKFSDVITSIYSDGDRGLWFGSFAKGLNYYDFRTKKISQYLHEDSVSQSLIHNNVWDIEQDENGGLWIGTLGGGIDYLEPGGKMFRHLRDVIPSVQIIDLHIDSDNHHLWAATEREGLYRINMQNLEVKSYTANNEQDTKLQSNIIKSIFEDVEGDIWIVTDHGLDRLDKMTGEIDHVITEDILKLGAISSIIQDEQGFMWIASSTGLHRMDNQNKEVLEFGVESTLIYNSYNSRAAHRLSDGRLAFGGVQSFSMVDPSAVLLNENPAPPVLTDLIISNKSIPIGSYGDRTILRYGLNHEEAEVALTYKDRGITFEFSATEFTEPGLNKFAYMLQGFDRDWQYTDAENRSASYSSLDGGHYTFKLKASNSSGIWSDEVRTIKVIVKPPFWETGLFISMAIGMLLFGIYIVYRFLLQREQEKHREQTLLQEKELLKREQQILQLTNTTLEKEVSVKKAELNASVLQAAHKNEFLNVLKNRIKKIKADADENASKPLRSVINIINTELKQEDYWAKFQINFDQTYQDFVERIASDHPNLTSNDHRLCCFIKMKLTNREIAAILNITISAIEQAKYRLKKKLDLDKSEKLYGFLQQYG